MEFWNLEKLELKKSEYVKYNIYINEEVHDNYCMILRYIVPIFLFIICNIGLKMSVFFIPAWVAIGGWCEVIFDYIVFILKPNILITKEEKKIKKEKIELAKIEEEKKKQELLLEQEKANLFSYLDIIELIEKYTSYKYPSEVNEMIQDFLSKLLFFVGDLKIHNVDPKLYTSFFKVHFCQIFDILISEKFQKNISNNVNLVNNLLKNLTHYIERETNRICFEQNLDDISTLEALKNFYSPGITFDIMDKEIK